MQNWLDFFSNPIVLLLLPVAFAWKLGLYSIQLKDRESPDFAQLRARINGVSSRETLYKAGLQRFLAWADRFFANTKKVDNQKTEAEPPVLSAKAYDRCLLMAVFYPMGAAIFGWLLFGNAGELGRAIGLDDLSAWLPRSFMIVYVVLYTGFWNKHNKTMGGNHGYGWHCGLR